MEVRTLADAVTQCNMNLHLKMYDTDRFLAIAPNKKWVQRDTLMANSEFQVNFREAEIIKHCNFFIGWHTKCVPMMPRCIGWSVMDGVFRARESEFHFTELRIRDTIDPYYSFETSCK